MKILKIEKLNHIIKKKKIPKNRIILCHGVFDLLHLGHVRYLKFAKNYKKKNNFLIVSVTGDKYIDKGLGRPYFNEKIRMEMLASLQIVDAVVLSNNFSAESILKKIRPGFYIKGQDYKNNKEDKSGKITLEKKIVERYGGRIDYSNEITFSSSEILNSTDLIFNEQQKIIINSLKKKYSYEKIISLMSKFKELKVSILGEIIFDEYCFGNVVGKAGKEPHLVLKEKITECYAGGSAAVARHLSSFVKKINIISFIGGEKYYKNILKNSLSSNVTLKTFKPFNNFSSIIKKRFIDESSNYKLFGSYIIPDKNLKIHESNVINLLKEIRNKSDLLIVTDYGHGLINQKISDNINRKFNFISLNAQLNATNVGTHSIKKYRNVDLIIINEAELRNELRNDNTKIEILAKEFFKTKICKNLVITRGKEGAMLVDKRDIYHCPAFSNKSVDKIGAGDAMLSILSLCLKKNFDKELSLFLGSVAGAYSVQTIGNKYAIDYNKITNFLKYALK